MYLSLLLTFLFLRVPYFFQITSFVHMESNANFVNCFFTFFHVRFCQNILEQNCIRKLDLNSSNLDSGYRRLCLLYKLLYLTHNSNNQSIFLKETTAAIASLLIKSQNCTAEQLFSNIHFFHPKYQIIMNLTGIQARKR